MDTLTLVGISQFQGNRVRVVRTSSGAKKNQVTLQTGVAVGSSCRCQKFECTENMQTLPIFP